MRKIATLSEAEIDEKLESLPGWGLDQGKLFKEYRFRDFVEAFAFMTRVADAAEAQNHHPEWFNVYSTVRVHLTTHDADGISDRDFTLARSMEAIADSQEPD